MAIQVRTIDASEFTGWMACKDVGFLNTRQRSEEYDRFAMKEVDFGRTWGAVDSDSGRLVGTLRSFVSRLTVPGPSQVIASSLTNVTVAPTHRRRGLLTQMMTGDLTASVDRGEPLAILIASEYPIYGRFGYGRAVDSAAYTVDSREARFQREPSGTVELVGLEDLRKEAPGVYDAYHAAQPGAIDRSDLWWDKRLHQVEIEGEDPPKGYCAIYRSESGDVDGYLRYNAESKWDGMQPRGVLNVDELVSLTPEAYQGLWQFCCDVDLISTVKASDRSVDEPLAWLLADGRSVRQNMRFDFIWVRVLDVCAALLGRKYATAGKLAIEIKDPMGFAAGRYMLETGADGASCSPTTEPADLVVPVDVLGSIYLGGQSLRTMSASGRTDELSAGAIARADLLFRSEVTPWCSTWF